MGFSYRLHLRGLVAALATFTLAALAIAAALPSPWRLAALLPLVGALPAFMLHAAKREEARSLGQIRLDDDAIRRIRGDGRAVEVLRWNELRRVVLDRRHRQLLFQGPDGSSLFCRGARPWGGVGLERFGELLAEIPRRTAIPVTPAARPRRRRQPPGALAHLGA
jgi:hypothetical protein